MLLNAVSVITEQVTGQSSPRPIPDHDWVASTIRSLRVSLDGKEHDIADVGLVMWRIYNLAQVENDPPVFRTTIHDPEYAKSRDLARVLLLPDRNFAVVSDMLGMNVRSVRNSKDIIEQWFDVRFMRLHHQTHHVTWWLPTRFAKRVWSDMEYIVQSLMEI